jgi:hypothetical protein
MHQQHHEAAKRERHPAALQHLECRQEVDDPRGGGRACGFCGTIAENGRDKRGPIEQSKK